MWKNRVVNCHTCVRRNHLNPFKLYLTTIKITMDNILHMQQCCVCSLFKRNPVTPLSPQNHVWSLRPESFWIHPVERPDSNQFKKRKHQGAKLLTFYGFLRRLLKFVAEITILKAKAFDLQERGFFFFNGL